MKIAVIVITCVIGAPASASAPSCSWARAAASRASAGAERHARGGVEPAGGRWSSWSACPGEVAAGAAVKVPISARVSARIVELPFKEWDTVTKGDPNANPPVPPSRARPARREGPRGHDAVRQGAYAAQEAQVVVTKARIESQRVADRRPPRHR